MAGGAGGASGGSGSAGSGAGGRWGAAGRQAAAWGAQRGLLVRAPPAGPSGAASGGGALLLAPAPLALAPAPFPRAAFEGAIALARPLNALVEAVSNNPEYLAQTLAPASAHDDFARRLLELHAEVRRRRGDAWLCERALGIHRSDYLLDEPSGRLLQVELNTIASSFGALASRVAGLHRALAGRFPELGVPDPSAVPDNKALEAIAEALAVAQGSYPAQDGLVLFVVQPGEGNVFDQELVREQLWVEHGVCSERRTLREVAAEARLDADGRLYLPGGHVSVVYFRAGYSPDDYPSEAEWDARVTLELSDAFKCPSIQYHLAGAKKVQQDLARPGVLEGFLPADDAASVRECFAGLWSLDDPHETITAAAIAGALAAPEDYVLKPQREGGGNNLYGEALAARLEQPEGLGAFILMQRIRPPAGRSVLLRGGEASEEEVVSELGVYSTYVRSGGAVLLDCPAGHLLRTKVASSDEGGVAAGFAVIDSPRLV